MHLRRTTLPPMEVLQQNLDQCITELNALNDFDIQVFEGDEFKLGSHANQIKETFARVRDQMATLIKKLYENGSTEKANDLRKERSILRIECNEILHLIRTTLGNNNEEWDAASISSTATRLSREEENEETQQTNFGSATGGAPAHQERAPVQDISQAINNSNAPLKKGITLTHELTSADKGGDNKIIAAVQSHPSRERQDHQTKRLDSTIDDILDSQIDFLGTINNKMSSQNVALSEFRTKHIETINKDQNIIPERSQQQGSTVGSHFISLDKHPENGCAHRVEPVDFLRDELNSKVVLNSKVMNPIVGRSFTRIVKSEPTAPAVAANIYKQNSLQSSFQPITSGSYGLSTDVHNNNNSYINSNSNYTSQAYGCSLPTGSRCAAQPNGGIVDPNAYGYVPQTHSNSIPLHHNIPNYNTDAATQQLLRSNLLKTPNKPYNGEPHLFQSFINQLNTSIKGIQLDPWDPGLAGKNLPDPFPPS